MPAQHPFFVEQRLAAGQDVLLPPALHKRLRRVLRLQDGEKISLFDGQTGVYSGYLAGTTVQNLAFEGAPLPMLPVTLLIGLPKREAMEHIVRQATELNVAAIQPVFAAHSVPTRLNMARMHTIAIEAAEQCERLTLPCLLPPLPLADALNEASGPLYWCCAREHAPHLPVIPTDAVSDSSNSAYYRLVVGPEGGFSAAETTLLASHGTPLSLGASVLRTDTAVVAGLSRMAIALENLEKEA